MIIIDLILFVITVFLRATKAITNQETTKTLLYTNVKFNKFLRNVKDSETRSLLKIFMKWFGWVSFGLFCIIALITYAKLKIPYEFSIFLFLSFAWTAIISFSINWAINHKKEISNFINKKNWLYKIIFLFWPIIFLLLDKFGDYGFYDSLRRMPSYPFPQQIPDIGVAIILPSFVIFVLFIFPYLLSFPVYLCIYLPLKIYIVYLRWVSNKLSKDFLYWSIILVDLTYGTWRIMF